MLFPNYPDYLVKNKMALRIRSNGRIFCAAMTDPLPGDTYICDQLHYEMSVVHGVLVSERSEDHKASAEWWWRNNVPEGFSVEVRNWLPSECCKTSE